MRPETALRAAVTAVLIGRQTGVAEPTLRVAYRAGLLRFLGCTSFAHETATRYAAGDDLAFLNAVNGSDSENPAKFLRRIELALAHVDPAQRAAALRNLATDRDAVGELARAHCDLAAALAVRLGVGDDVASTLCEVFERWDGKGYPFGLAGEAISEGARLVMVAVRVVTLHTLEGAAEMSSLLRARSGTELDPRFVDAYFGCRGDVVALLARESVWDTFLDAEPTPHAERNVAALPEIAAVFADYVDLKSPFTIGHSRGVAELVRRTASAVGLDAEDSRKAHLAALLHDLGRVAVPNGIWDKPGALGPIERERASSHAAHTTRILSGSALFAGITEIAACAHERADASGYPRGIPSSMQPRGANLLAACDVYHALREDRAHRRGRALDAAAEVLRDHARRGVLDADVVDAVLSLEGARARTVTEPRVYPDGLTGRETEVLRLLARGLSNKEIAARLDISPKTVQHHVAHVYDKTGIRTRAGAALYAVEHRLVEL